MQKKRDGADLRALLTGGDRRSIADSNRVRALIHENPALVPHLARLTDDADWLVVQRALDLMETLAHEHTEWNSKARRAKRCKRARGKSGSG